MTEHEPIYIDADEEITAVIDKLKEAPGPTVLFVVPKGASLLQSVVNLKLLKKEADDRGKNVALVTGDQVGRNLATQVGILVYQDTEMKEVVPTPLRPDRPSTDDVVELDMSEREKEASRVAVHHYKGEPSSPARSSRPTDIVSVPGRSKKRIIAGLLLFIVALAGLLVFYPKTTIVLGVKSEPFNSSIELTLDKNVTEANKNSSLLPGTDLTLEKEKVTTAQATGKRTVGEKARGMVTVANCYQSITLSLASGTTLTSGGKSFVTTAAVNIPAATIVGSNCTAAGEADVTIEASAVGGDANLGANASLCVTGYSCSGGTYVNATNDTALSGGSSREVTFLRQEDIDTASETAKGELVSEVTKAIQTMAENQNLRVLDAALDTQVTEKTSDKAVGTETNDAQITTKVRIRTLAFRETDYRQLIVDLLSLRLDPGKRLILSGDDEIATSVVEANWEEGFIKIRGDVKTHVADVLDQGEVKALAKNKSVGSAAEALRTLSSVQEVTIATTPRFLNRTALFTRNLVIEEVAQ